MNGRATGTGEEPCGGPPSDRHLLTRFVDHADEDAFAQLVARHGGLVLGVCRRALGDREGAEDAFQATFLVLARRASRIRRRASLAGWLHAVAYRTAQRAGARRRRWREEPLPEDMTATDDTLAQVASRYEQQLLDEELDRLPARYREPLVMRYLMGKSNREVARELGVALGVVEGRIKRGKDRLRLRLVRRGISVTGVLAAVAANVPTLEAATVEPLIATTARAAAAFRTGASPPESLAQNAIPLAEKELAMSASTLAATTSGIAAAAVIAGLSLGLPGRAGELAPSQAAEIVAAQAVVAAAPADDGEPDPVEVVAAENSEPGPEADGASAAVKKIEAALQTTAELEFIETPLADVMDAIQEMHKINVEIDQRALDDVGVPSDVPVTKSLAGISLASALNLMLREMDLTWTIQDEVLLITTPEVEETLLITRLYEVGDLVVCRDESGDEWADYDSLIEVLTTTVKPESWEDVGGPASVAAAPLGAEMLAIAHTYRMHSRIEQLLEEMRAIAREKGGEPPVREKPAQPRGLETTPFGGAGAKRPAAPAKPGADPFAPPARADDDPFAAPRAPAKPPRKRTEKRDEDEVLGSEALRDKYERGEFGSFSPNERQVWEELDRLTDFEFIETPLVDFLDTLEDYHNIQIELDVNALDAVGIPADCPVSKSLKGISLRAALNLVLRDMGLTHVVRDEVLLITTPAEADAMLQTHVYSLHRLKAFDSENVARVIRATIRPGTWRGAEPEKPAPAPGSPESSPARPGVIEALPGSLVVTHSPGVHERIVPLLAELARFKEAAEALRTLPKQ